MTQNLSAAPNSTLQARSLRIGTRASELALVQANTVKSLIHHFYPQVVVELVEMTSDGDRDPRHLRDIGERGIFAAHLERALLAGEIDAAVHSSKDLTLELHPELELAAWLKREDPRDALIGADGAGGLAGLPPSAVLATGSARRTAQALTLRADLSIQPIRGNVHTRIKRSQERGDNVLMLAMAGLNRLGVASTPTQMITPLAIEDFVPDAGQGAVVVQTRRRDADDWFDWSCLDHLPTRRSVELERALGILLGGGCSQPVGVYADIASARVLIFKADSPDSRGRRLDFELRQTEVERFLASDDPATVKDAVSSVLARLTDLDPSQ